MGASDGGGGGGGCQGVGEWGGGRGETGRGRLHLRNWGDTSATSALSPHPSLFLALFFLHILARLPRRSTVRACDLQGAPPRESKVLQKKGQSKENTGRAGATVKNLDDLFQHPRPYVATLTPPPAGAAWPSLCWKCHPPCDRGPCFACAGVTGANGDAEPSKHTPPHVPLSYRPPLSPAQAPSLPSAEQLR